MNDLFRAMWVSDLDGTLKRTGEPVSAAFTELFAKMGTQKVLRVIATGRHLYSIHNVIGKDFPCDYIIFSSGLGHIHWPTQTVSWEAKFPSAAIDEVKQKLRHWKLDFMIHEGLPNNHHFTYYTNGSPSADFMTRLEFYRKFASEGRDQEKGGSFSQFIVIVPGERGTAVFTQIKEAFPYLSVIRTTSPFDHQSAWIEVFAKEVSKSQRAELLRGKYQVAPQNTLATGNDYNDIDLLEWAACRYLVAGCAPDLPAHFDRVTDPSDAAFVSVVERWSETRIQT